MVTAGKINRNLDTGIKNLKELTEKSRQEQHLFQLGPVMGTQIVERKANEDPATMGEPPRSLSFAAAGPPMVYSYCLLVQYGCWEDVHTTVLTVLEISKGLG